MARGGAERLLYTLLQRAISLASGGPRAMTISSRAICKAMTKDRFTLLEARQAGERRGDQIR